MTDEEYKSIMKQIDKMEKRDEERFVEMDEIFKSLMDNLEIGLNNLSSQMDIVEVKQTGLYSTYKRNFPLKSNLEWTYRNAGLGNNNRRQERVRKFF